MDKEKLVLLLTVTTVVLPTLIRLLLWRAQARRDWKICFAATALFYLAAFSVFAQSDNTAFVVLLLLPLPIFYIYATYHLVLALRITADVLDRAADTAPATPTQRGTGA